jgi:hypothetical protein
MENDSLPYFSLIVELKKKKNKIIEISTHLIKVNQID